MPLRAVLFDLDCTLTDRRRSIDLTARRFASQFRLPDGCTVLSLADAMWQADHWGYRDRREFFAELIETIHWREPATMEQLQRFWVEDFPACAAFADGARELLIDLRRRGYLTAIVTNGAISKQGGKIRHLRIDELVDSVVISHAVGVDKPHRRMFEYALESLDVTAGESIFVGDHPINDILGAQRAGIRGVWISGIMPYPEGQARPWRTISHVRELQHLIGDYNLPRQAQTARL